jgi:hypothetical protein
MKRITFFALITLAVWASTMGLADAKPSYGGNCASCHIQPVVTDFSIPTTSDSLTVPIDTFTAEDTGTLPGVSGYLVTESPTPPNASASGWSSSAPSTYTFVSTGLKTLYAWVKDRATLVSESVSTQVDISAPNGAPVAQAGPAQLSAYIGDTVTLDGNGSSDPDNDPLTYRWSLTSKPNGSGAALSGPATVSPSFVMDVFGDYRVQLVVNDGTIDSPPDTVTIRTVNNPPTAYAGPDVKVYIVDNTVVPLDGSGSIDPDGDALTYQWSLVTRPSGSQASLSGPTAVNPTFVVDVPGTYIAELVVNDGKANSAPDSVTISTENTAPVAKAGPGQTAGVGDTITLDGSGSSDLDGDALTYQWSLSVPAGSTAELSGATTVNPTFVADVDGDYMAELIVNDGKIDSEPSIVQISTLNSPPVAEAGPDQQQLVGSVVSLDGSGSSDPDGNSLTFQWSFSALPDGSAASFSDPSAESPDFIADVAGEYVIQLIVNDGKEGLGADTVVVSVASDEGSPTTEPPPVVSDGGSPTTEPPPVIRPNREKDDDDDKDDDDRSDRKHRKHKNRNNRYPNRERERDHD